MNYIREAEKYLWHYRDLKRSLEHINDEIQKLKWAGAPTDISSLIMDGMPHVPYRDDMVNLMFRLQVMEENKRKTEEKISEIGNILVSLDNDERCKDYSEILRAWYVDKLPKDEIAKKLSYSPHSVKSIYRLKNEAIRKFAIRLFGLSVLEAI